MNKYISPQSSASQTGAHHTVRSPQPHFSQSADRLNLFLDEKLLPKQMGMQANIKRILTILSSMKSRVFWFLKLSQHSTANNRRQIHMYITAAHENNGRVLKSEYNGRVLKSTGLGSYMYEGW